MMEYSAEVAVLEAALEFADKVCPYGLAKLDMLKCGENNQACQVIVTAIKEVLQGFEVDRPVEERKLWEYKLCSLFLVKLLKGVATQADGKDAVDETILSFEEGYFDAIVDHWPSVSAALFLFLLETFDWTDHFLDIVKFTQDDIYTAALTILLREIQDSKQTHAYRTVVTKMLLFTICHVNPMHSVYQSLYQNQIRRSTSVKNIEVHLSHLSKEFAGRFAISCSVDDLMVLLLQTGQEFVNHNKKDPRNNYQCLGCCLNFLNYLNEGQLIIIPSPIFSEDKLQQIIYNCQKYYSEPICLSTDVITTALAERLYQDNVDKSGAFISQLSENIAGVALDICCTLLQDNNVLSNIIAEMPERYIELNTKHLYDKIMHNLFIDAIMSANLAKVNIKASYSVTTRHETAIENLKALQAKISKCRNKDKDHRKEALHALVEVVSNTSQAAENLRSLISSSLVLEKVEWMQVIAEYSHLLDSVADVSLLVQALSSTLDAREQLDFSSNEKMPYACYDAALVQIGQMLQQIVLSVFGKLSVPDQNLALAEIHAAYDTELLFRREENFESNLLSTLNKLVNSDSEQICKAIACFALQSSRMVLDALISEAISNQGKTTLVVKVLCALPNIAVANGESSMLMDILQNRTGVGLPDNKEFDNLTRMITALLESNLEKIFHASIFVKTCVVPYLTTYQLSKPASEQESGITLVQALELLQLLLEKAQTLDWLRECSAAVLMYTLCTIIDYSGALWESDFDCKIQESVEAKERATKVLETIIGKALKDTSLIDRESVIWVLVNLSSCHWSTQLYLHPLLELYELTEEYKAIPRVLLTQINSREMDQATGPTKTSEFGEMLVTVEACRIPSVCHKVHKNIHLGKDKQYMHLLIALSQVLPHCIAGEWTNIWTFMQEVFKEANEEGGVVNLPSGVQASLTTMTKLVTIWRSSHYASFPDDQVWHHVARCLAHTCKECLLKNQQPSFSTVEELNYHKDILCGLCDIARRLPAFATEHLFMVALDELTLLCSLFSKGADINIGSKAFYQIKQSVQKSVCQWPVAPERETLVKKFEV